MPELVGRDAEMAALNAHWQQAVSGQPQLVAVWGRRRVGKTYLLSHVAADKPHIYFTATRQDSEARQLDRLFARMSEQLGSRASLLDVARPVDWEGALRLLLELARDEPLLVVLDEMPRLLAGRPDFADVLSAVWENYAREQKLMLVVTGSAVSTMEEALGAHGGLRGRPQLQMRLDPFRPHEARAFLPAIPAEQFVVAYAVCGGYPLHLRSWQDDLTVENNLLHLAFRPGGLLLADALDIMSEDLDWRSGYERVLAAIGTTTGVRRGKIASRANQRVDYTLAKLQQAGYVRTERPLGEGSTATPLYAIADTYIGFWLGVLRDDAELIEGGQGQAVLHRRRSRLERHVSAVFEQMAREHATRLVTNGRLPPDTVIGRWWRDEQVEIDVVALSGEQPVLIGEAKWEATPVGQRELALLQRKAAALPAHDEPPQLALWSKTGATDGIADGAGSPWIFTASDML